MTSQPGRSMGSSAALAAAHLALVLSTVAVGCAHDHRDAASTRSVADSRPTSTIDARLRPVLSAGAGLFIILGPARLDDEPPLSLQRREYLGYDADLVVVIRPSPTGAPRYTLVSEERQCVARAREPVVLWIARRDQTERLTGPVDAVMLDGCGELVFGEWLVALDGAHERARWHRPVHEASLRGRAEVTEAMTALGGRAALRPTDGETHLARFELEGTPYSALVVSPGPLHGALPRVANPCATERHITISLVLDEHVVATFEAGDHLGVVSVGDARFVVHLGAERSELRAWHVMDSGLDLVTRTARPTYSDSLGC